MVDVADTHVMEELWKNTPLIGGIVVLVVVILILTAVYYRKPRTTPKPPHLNEVAATSVEPNQPSPPSPFADGSVVKCETTGSIYRVEGGKLRRYAVDRYNALGRPQATIVSCDLIAGMEQGMGM